MKGFLTIDGTRGHESARLFNGLYNNEDLYDVSYFQAIIERWRHEGWKLHYIWLLDIPLEDQ